jgi:hypothetical protein
MFTIVFKYFLGVFAIVSNTCFKCFIWLLLYIAIVVSGCFKSRSGVAHGIRVDDVRGGVGNVRGDTGNVRGDVGPLLMRSLASPTR